MEDFNVNQTSFQVSLTIKHQLTIYCIESDCYIVFTLKIQHFKLQIQPFHKSMSIITNLFCSFINFFNIFLNNIK